MVAELFLTTQPGWAFATLAEIRARGVQRYVHFCHRDSSLVAPAHPLLLGEELCTPADVYGCLLEARGARRQDASEALCRSLDPQTLKRRVRPWLARAHDACTRRYSVGSEVWGDTSVHRKVLADRVRAAFRQAFPEWQERPSGGLRLFCKADAAAALLGVQLYSNLGHEDETEFKVQGSRFKAGRPAGITAAFVEGRPGALREHLACSLLTLARVGPDDAVLDPCMGTGTILRAAWLRFGVRTCLGADIDAEAYEIARRKVRAPDARLEHRPFEHLDLERLPGQIKLVSNLPFGVRFAPVATDRLLDFLARLRPTTQGIALLMGRAQARQVGQALDLRVKNVLVLGQPAGIVYSLGWAGPG